MKIAYVLAFMAGSSVAAGADTEFTKQGSADPRGRVDIANVSGSVDITTWDRPEFAVNAKLQDGVERVDITSRDGTTQIRVVLKKGKRNLDADLKISVPAGSRIEASGVSASIAQHGNFTSSFLLSVSGSVKVEGAGEELEVRSVSGSVEVSMPSAQRVRLRSVSGRTAIAATLAPMATVELETVTGSVDARLRGDQGFRFELSSFGGLVDNCFAAGQKYGNVGAGSGNVRLRTHSGSVTLCDK